MTIIVIAFNRLNELKNLLKSISVAEYGDDSVDLVISIDYGNNEDVIKLATNFHWEFGNKKVIAHEYNLGLRKHVMFCANLTQTLGNIILLEDDLYLSTSFYRFAKESLLYYKSDDNIAGISLYTYSINEYTGLRPFSFMIEESDVFFMQVPSSWGLALSPQHWRKFKEWYDNNQDLTIFHGLGLVPDRVLSWSDASWKKYFAVYLAVSGRYFVYPKTSQSTNMGSLGTHNNERLSNFQVNLAISSNTPFSFKRFEDSDILKYDAFFESNYLKKFLEPKYGRVIIDYYGTKTNYLSSKYLLTTKKLNFLVEKQWELALRPYELNVINDIHGKGLYLYNLNSLRESKNEISMMNLLKYENPYLTKEIAIKIAIEDYFSAIKRGIRRGLKRIKKCG